MESVGWVAPRPNEVGPLLESIGGQWVLKLQTESKSVPAATVKKHVAERVKKIEDEQGRRVGRKEKRELKEIVITALLPRAFSRTSSTMVWLDLANRNLVIGAASQRASDAVVGMLMKASEDAGTLIELDLLQTAMSPSAAISSWLQEKEAPPAFTLDRDLELRQPDEEKSVVRYARHNLEIEEVVAHIASGKMPTQIAMTWNDRVSFVLCADLTLKKIELLDHVFVDTSEEDYGFDGDVALFTGELIKLLRDLVVALGGVHDPEA